MPRRASIKRTEDVNESAFRTVQQLTRDRDEAAPAAPMPAPKKNAAAVALGKLGGSKGGKTRAANLTPERRREIAQQAAAKRWDRTPDSAGAHASTGEGV